MNIITTNTQKMKYKLTYTIGLTIVQEWVFNSKNLAHYKKWDLIETGRFNMGHFKIETI